MKGTFLLGLAALFPLSGVSAAPASNVQAVFDAGQCLVQHDRASAVTLMRTLPPAGSAAQAGTLARNGMECAASLAGEDSLMVRGAIAQALYLRDFGGYAIEPRDMRALAAFTLPIDDSAGSQADPRYRWADCVARNDPDDTDRLLHSAVGSDSEARAFESFRPMMSVCLGDGQMALAAGEVRALLAQSAYYGLYRYWNGQLRGARR
jgi:hypothetical protein